MYSWEPAGGGETQKCPELAALLLGLHMPSCQFTLSGSLVALDLKEEVTLQASGSNVFRTTGREHGFKPSVTGISPARQQRPAT